MSRGVREHHRVKKGTSTSPPIQLGDIVTVMEEGKSNRGPWKLRKVQHIVSGSDGLAYLATAETVEVNSSSVNVPIGIGHCRNFFQWKSHKEKLKIPDHFLPPHNIKDQKGRQQL